MKEKNYPLKNGNKQMDIFVPERINRKIRYYANKIVANPVIKYIPVIPEPFANVNECFPNVKDKIRRNNGKMLIGWQIWETPILLEAEFHAIWQSPNNEEIDITPKLFNLNRILFVEDNDSNHTGIQVNNIRFNTTGNPLVDDFILLNDALFKIQNKRDRENKQKIILKGEEAILFEYLKTIKIELEEFIYSGATLNSNCFCGRDKDYYRCHGDELKELIKKI